MRNLITSCSLFLFLTSTLLGQSIQFEAAFKNSEISQVSTALIQDNQGFLWIGTSDGLYRYDGHEVREFRHDPTDSASISNNYIKALYVDRKGNIWIGTNQGLNCYHGDTEKISRHSYGNSQKIVIHNIMEDHKGNIWYGSYEGLWKLNLTTNELSQYLPDVEQKQTLTSKIVWSVFEDQQHRIWVGTNGGFTIFENDGTLNFKPYHGNYEQASGLPADRIFHVIQQPDSTIWLSSHDGIFKVNEEKEGFQFQKFSTQKNNSNSLSQNFISLFTAEGNKKLWAGTYSKGLNEIILPKTQNDSIQFIHHQHDPENHSSLSLNQIESFLIDKSGLIWVGTGTRLDKTSKTINKFQTLNSSTGNPSPLSNNIIKSIYQDSYGNLWIGTYNGLNFLSAENLKHKKFDFEQFTHDSNNPHSISHNNIGGINEDSRGYLWINSYYGLNYIHISTFLKNKQFNHFNESHGIPHTYNFSTDEIEKGSYWVTCYNGLAKMTFDPLHPSEVKFKVFEMHDHPTGAIVNSSTRKVIKDKFNSFWIGTFNGISKYVKKNGDEYFENYLNDPDDPKSLSNNSFRCFFKDSKGRTWIGTRSGLNLILQSSKDKRATFKRFGIKDGFPNDVIHSIQEDRKGLLWMSTNKGLVVFNPDYDKAIESPVVKTYTQQDGLASSSFVFRSSFKDDLGNLYFGTAKGLNYFDPDKIPQNTYIPPVRFTQLKVLNEIINPQDKKDAILQKSITIAKKITLTHWQNIISIHFAAMDFNKPEKNQYQYKLSGLNEDWVKNGSDNSVTFTNLPQGTHTLLVKGSNNDGFWNETPASLIIEVLPPFWKTWWAYALYLLLLVSTVYAFIQFRIRQKVNKIKAAVKLEKARAEEREILRKNNAADFHDELGHRFTKISLFLELAERQSTSNDLLKNYLNKIKTNVIGLSEGVRDLIWSLDPNKDSMYQTLTRLQEFGDGLFEFSDIHFKTNGINKSLDKIELAPDIRKNILMIFKEAMNNSLKYSAAQNASLTTKSESNYIYLIFQDDGKGFDPYKIKNGYGLKNMQSRATKVEGKLTIHSTVGKGTEVILNLTF